MTHTIDVNIEALEVPSHLTEADKISTQNSISKLRFFKLCVERMKSVADFNNDIPDSLKTITNEYTHEIINLYTNLSSVLHQTDRGKTEDYLQKWRQAIEKINRSYHDAFQTGSGNKFLLAFNTLSSLSPSPLTTHNLQLEEMKDNLEEQRINVFKLEESANKLINDLTEGISKTVVKDYVQVFETQIKEDSRMANNWLKISIGLASGLIIFIVFSFINNWFDIVQLEPLNNSGTINYSNLLSKIFIISLGIYALSFCIKQYSIYRNLEELNKHRRNALKSYTLFSDSIGKDDPESRNALMLQVAKAIYDHSPTGHLSSKLNDNASPSVIDLTKIINTPK